MITSVYPVVMTTDVAATAAFFTEHFGFEIVFDADWYVSLKTGAYELAVLDSEHPTIPAGYRQPAAGLLINIEVENVDEVFARLDAQAVNVAQELRSEDFGQRHVILVAPGGVLVDVIQPIEPTGEYAG